MRNPAPDGVCHELLGLSNNASMQPRRVVLSTLGSLGDLHPIMGLALELRARGHHVLLATSEFHREHVLAAGLPYHGLRPLAAPSDPAVLRQVLHPIRGPEYLIRCLLLPHLREMYEDLLQATEHADFLITGEVVLAAPLVTEKRQLPWATAILAPFSFFSIHDPPPWPFLPHANSLTRLPPVVQRQLLRLGRLAVRHWGRPIIELRRSLSLRPTRDPLLTDRFSPYLNLALFSSVLGQPQRDWPANTVQCGFVFYDHGAQGLSAGLKHFLDNGEPPITFTLGSAAVMDPGRFFEESAVAARMLRARALLLMGNNARPQDNSGHLFAEDYAPYSQIFSRSACLVHQGGVGTTAQALRSGTPQLVMPYAFDQPDNAARVARIGAGLSVTRRRYAASTAAALVHRLMSEPRFRSTCSTMAKRIDDEHGVQVAADAVERELRQRT